jgi:hypothetical protein
MAVAIVLGGLGLIWLGSLVVRFRLILVTAGIFGLLTGAYAAYSNSVPQWSNSSPPYTKWGVPVTERVDPPEPGTPLRVPKAAAFQISVMSGPSAEKEGQLIASGVFVMAGREIGGDEIPDSLKAEIGFRYRDIYDSTRWTPNGCFALKDLGSKEGSVGVLAPYGLVGWQEGPPDSIWGRLYQSPDSTYDLRLRVQGDRIGGTGQGNFGFSVGSTLIERFDGQRLGDADLKECFEQAAQLQREGRGLSTGN